MCLFLFFFFFERLLGCDGWQGSILFGLHLYITLEASTCNPLCCLACMSAAQVHGMPMLRVERFCTLLLQHTSMPWHAYSLSGTGEVHCMQAVHIIWRTAVCGQCYLPFEVQCSTCSCVIVCSLQACNVQHCRCVSALQLVVARSCSFCTAACTHTPCKAYAHDGKCSVFGDAGLQKHQARRDCAIVGVCCFTVCVLFACIPHLWIEMLDHAGLHNMAVHTCSSMVFRCPETCCWCVFTARPHVMSSDCYNTHR